MKRALFTSNCSSNYSVAEIIRCTWHCYCDACSSFFPLRPKRISSNKKMKCNLNFSVFMLRSGCMHVLQICGCFYAKQCIKVSVLEITLSAQDFANNVILSSLSIYCCFCCIHTSLRNCSYNFYCGNSQVLLEYFGEKTLHIDQKHGHSADHSSTSKLFYLFCFVFNFKRFWVNFIHDSICFL